MNPVDEYLDKYAQQLSLPLSSPGLFAPGGIGSRALHGVGKAVGEGATSAAGAAVVSGALLGIGAAIKKLHGAMTKQRDFRNMMSLYPQLQDAQQQRPEMFNAAYSSLRKLNPAFGTDPVVSGAYMEKIMIISPERTGLLLAEVAGQKSPQGIGVSGVKLGPLSLK